MNPRARTVGGLLLVALLCASTPGWAQQIRYYHLDAIGSVRAISNASGAVVERHDYLPFGEECTTGTCAQNPGLSAGGSRKFTGKERDSETGLDYFGARYYGSKVARFTTVDPVYTWRENLVDPKRWNRYAYVMNNPLRYVDPDGRIGRDVTAAQVAEFQRQASAAGPVDLPLWFDLTIGAGATLAVAPLVYLLAEAAPGLAASAVVAAANPRNQQVAAEVVESLAGVPSPPKGDWAQLSGMLRQAARGRGNFGIGSATVEQAEAIGRAWVGDGATTARDARTLISADGLRQYRPASYKPRLGRRQANLEARSEASGQWQSNAHVDIGEKQ